MRGLCTPPPQWRASGGMALRRMIGSCRHRQFGPLAMDVAALSVRRCLSTASSDSSASPSSSSSKAQLGSRSEEAILQACRWQSSSLEERLGFTAGEAITEERLKAHFFILARHYHPDTSTAPNATEAFQSIKDAYDTLSSSMKHKNHSSRGGGAGGASGFPGGFHFADEARRRSQIRVLGEAVLLFMVMTFLFIIVVARHNKERLQSRYLWHLVGIFFIIQIFPRLLAAAVLFAAHSSYLLEAATFKEQAAVSLVVERNKRECDVRLDGIHDDVKPDIVVQVTTTAVVTISDDVAVARAAAPEMEVSSVLTFDKGVTNFSLPIPVGRRAVYHIKAVDEKRNIVLADKQLAAF